MKMLVAAVIAGTFATAAFHPGGPASMPGAGSAIIGVAKPAAPERDARRYLIANAMLGKTCFLSRRNGTNRIAAERACDIVWPGLSGVETLTENPDGTFALQGRRGQPVLKLVAGDGVAFEAVEPRRALITISAAD